MKRWGRVLAEAAVLSGVATVGAVLLMQWHPRRPIIWQGPAPVVATRPFITVEEALALDEVVWIDARDAASYARGHIPGARRLDPREWDTLIVPLYEDLQNYTIRLVVYGDADQASAARVSQKLEESYGRPNVPILQGGWEAWRQQAADGRVTD